MSSILEALRELEGERPPATRRELPPAEKPPGVTRRATGALIPVLGGLALGVVAFGLYAWGPRLVVAPPSSEPAARGALPPADAGTAEPPTWLDKADAPRARVNRGATPAPAPERAATRAPAEAEAADPAPAEPREEPRPSSSGGQFVVEAISYSENAVSRVATVRFKGRRVTLREREAIDGIEIQLIMPNGVYVQRGTETYMLPLSR